MAKPENDPVGLPDQPIHRLLAPLERFLHVEAASGVFLLGCAVVSLALANSPFADAFLGFWKTPFTLGLGAFEMRHSIQHWLNDGLMAIFFFVVGLEVKREITLGELRDLRRASLPLAAALGGMIVPAAIYLSLQAGQPGESGWGIPMATDIAFVVGCMAILGSRVPHGLRVMVLSLAIADDIGAILVIALGYSAGLDVTALAWGGVGIAAILLCQRLGVRSFLVYTLIGAGVWLAFHESGVHATVAGVIIGLLTPAETYLDRTRFGTMIERVGSFLRGGEADGQAPRPADVRQLQRATRETVSPLVYLEDLLHPWVGFAIMPLFALANAGVPVKASYFSEPLAMAVAAGLVVGKPLGIVAFSWIAVRLGLAKLPERVDWLTIVGAGALAGIGFTMALFIAGLALDPAILDPAKMGVLAGSAVSALIGMGILRARLK